MRDISTTPSRSFAGNCLNRMEFSLVEINGF